MGLDRDVPMPLLPAKSEEDLAKTERRATFGIVVGLLTVKKRDVARNSMLVMLLCPFYDCDCDVMGVRNVR